MLDKRTMNLFSVAALLVAVSFLVLGPGSLQRPIDVYALPVIVGAIIGVLLVPFTVAESESNRVSAAMFTIMACSALIFGLAGWSNAAFGSFDRQRIELPVLDSKTVVRRRLWFGRNDNRHRDNRVETRILVETLDPERLGETRRFDIGGFSATSLGANGFRAGECLVLDLGRSAIGWPVIYATSPRPCSPRRGRPGSRPQLAWPLQGDLETWRWREAASEPSA
jgi:hypothetical protein